MIRLPSSLGEFVQREAEGLGLTSELYPESC